MDAHDFSRQWFVFGLFMSIFAGMLGALLVLGGKLYFLVMIDTVGQTAFRRKATAIFVVYVMAGFAVIHWLSQTYVINYFTRFDSSGVSWPTLMGGRHVPWSQVQSCHIFSVSGEKRAILLQTSAGELRLDAYSFKNVDSVVGFIHEKVPACS